MPSITTHPPSQLTRKQMLQLDDRCGFFSQGEIVLKEDRGQREYISSLSIYKVGDRSINRYICVLSVLISIVSNLSSLYLPPNALLFLVVYCKKA